MRGMAIVLDNGTVRAEISETGAELLSARRGGAEYIWGGDPAFWEERSPILFPICGRLPDKTYLWRGKAHELGLHGFARFARFETAGSAPDRVRFELRDAPETRARYPFSFLLSVEYRLVGATLRIAATVRNETGAGGEVLPFQLGFHPGFAVPLGGEGAFSDWEVAFDEPCDPDRVLFSERSLPTGLRRAFPLRDRRVLPLEHGMFDAGGIFLAGVSKAATLRSARSKRSVRMEFADFRYLGMWHTPDAEAPFVCLEPWSGLPSFDGVREDFATKSGMTRLAPGEAKSWRLALTFGA